MYSQATIFVLSLSLLTTYCCCCCFLSFYCCCYSIYKRLKSDSVKKKFSLVQNLSLLSRYLELLYTRLVELDVVSSYTFFFLFHSLLLKPIYITQPGGKHQWKGKEKKKGYTGHYKILVADSFSIRPNLEKLLFVFFFFVKNLGGLREVTLTTTFCFWFTWASE